MKLLEIFEKIALLFFIGLLFTPLVIVALIVLFIGLFSSYARKKIKYPLKGLYLGFEIGAITGIILSGLWIIYMLILKIDSFGAFIGIPINTVTLIIGGIAGIIYGIKKNIK